MARYLDLLGLTNTNQAIYAKALNVQYDSDELPATFKVGDSIITGPFAAEQWSWLPGWVKVQVVPDNTKPERLTPLEHQVRQIFGKIIAKPALPSLPKKGPTEAYLKRIDRYLAYAECEAWAAERTYTTIELGDAPFPYEVITEPVRATEVMRSLWPQWFALDFEYDPQGTIIGLGLATEQDTYYIAQDGLRALPELRHLLTAPRKVSHYSKAEYKTILLWSAGTLQPTDFPPFYDTQIMDWLAMSSLGGHDLKGMTERKLGRQVLRFTDIAPEGDLSKLPLELQARYAAADPRNTLDLFFSLRDDLKAAGLWDVYTRIELPLTPVLVEMEAAGMDVDREELRRQVEYYSTLKDNLAEAMFKLGFTGSPTSPDQVAAWFYEDLKLPVIAKTQKRGSVAAPIIDQLYGLHPAVPVYKSFIKYGKLLNTFLLPIYNSGQEVMHYSIQQTSTRTGRLSCTAEVTMTEEEEMVKGEGTNMQNWPLLVRKIIKPRDGMILWSCDFRQIEPRIGAVASGDEQMLDDYRNNRDPYISLGLAMGFNRERVLTEEPVTRRIIKAVFLGWMYGASGEKLQQTARKDDVLLSVDECNRYVEMLVKTRPRFDAWRKEVIMATHESGEARSLFNRRRLIPQIWSTDPATMAEAERWAVNMTIQGTAADIIKRVMPTVARLLKQMGSSLQMQVHDEIDFCLEPGVEVDTIVEAMVNAALELGLEIPLEVAAAHGQNWYEAHA